MPSIKAFAQSQRNCCLCKEKLYEIKALDFEGVICHTPRRFKPRSFTWREKLRQLKGNYR